MDGTGNHIFKTDKVCVICSISTLLMLSSASWTLHCDWISTYESLKDVTNPGDPTGRWCIAVTNVTNLLCYCLLDLLLLIFKNN